jgi:Thioredoxin-like/Surface antigen variable number repeat
MPNVTKGNNAARFAGVVLLFGWLFCVGGVSAQTAAEPPVTDAKPQARDTKDATFTPVVIENVTIQGADDLGADETAKLAESLKGEAYTDKWLDRLTNKVTRRLMDEGYWGAAAKTTVRTLESADGRQHVAVTVDVDAGPRNTLAVVWWRGSSVFTTKQLDDMILLRRGDVLRAPAIRESYGLLQKAYAERGYRDAFIGLMFDKDSKSGKTTLYLDIQEGEKSSGDKVATEKKPECTAPTMEEIRKARFTPSAEPYDPKVDAQLEIERAKLEAERTNRNVLLIAGGDWCGWCHMLDQTFQSSIPTRELRDRNFLVVHVNVSEENDNSCALRAYPKATGYPFLYVINPSGRLLATSDTREFESPYGYNATKIEEFLKKW